MSALQGEFVNAYGLCCFGIPFDCSSKNSKGRFLCCLYGCCRTCCLLPAFTLIYLVCCPCCVTFRELRAKNNTISVKFCCRWYSDVQEGVTLVQPPNPTFQHYLNRPIDADDFNRCCCLIIYNFDFVPQKLNWNHIVSHSIIFCRTKKLDEVVCELKARQREVSKSVEVPGGL
jgi:hypothetical protein